MERSSERKKGAEINLLVRNYRSPWPPKLPFPQLPEFKGFFWEYGSAKSIPSCRLGHKGVNVITCALDLSDLLQRDHWKGGRLCVDGRYVKEEEE